MNDINSAQLSLGIRQKEIDGNIYTIKLLPGLACLKEFSKITGFLAPLLGSAGDAYMGPLGEFPMTDISLTDLGIVLATQLDKLEVQQFASTLLQGATKNSVALDINNSMGGELDVLLSLLEWAIEENFKIPFEKWLKANFGMETITFGQLANQMFQREEENEQSSQG